MTGKEKPNSELLAIQEQVPAIDLGKTRSLIYMTTELFHDFNQTKNIDKADANYVIMIEKNRDELNNTINSLKENGVLKIEKLDLSHNMLTKTFSNANNVGVGFVPKDQVEAIPSRYKTQITSLESAKALIAGWNEVSQGMAVG